MRAHITSAKYTYNLNLLMFDTQHSSVLQKLLQA